MLRIANPNIIKPARYPIVERHNPHRKPNGEWDKGFDMVGGYKLREYIDLMPQSGIQERAVACNSNVIFVCGESQIGKTFLILLSLAKGIGLQNYTGRFISVRLQDSKKGTSILRDAMTVLGNFASCEVSTSDYPTFYWRKWNNSVQFIHSNYNAEIPKEWEEFQDYAKKNQASLIAIDEATEMKSFKMFAYWMSRNRDDSGRTPQMICSFNFVHEHWTTAMLKDAGYIGSDWYVIPEMNGVTKYFYNAGDSPAEMIWGNTPEEVNAVAHLDERITAKERAAGVTYRELIKSFTMFTGETADNLKLLAATQGQNIGNLHNTGATQRAILKFGYAGPIDSEELTVSRQMIHNLWENPQNDDENMYATLDVSGGGEDSDDCPMVIWRGLTIVALKFFRGNPKELVTWIDQTLTEYKVPVRNFAFDATGLGYYLKGYSEGMPVTANRRTVQEIDQYGNPVTIEQYFNLRSQLLGKTRVMLERGDLSCTVDKDLEIPYGKKGMKRRFIDVLFDEINVFVATTRNRKIYYRHKDEYKSKFQSSPDLMDAISYRAMFEFDARPKKAPLPVIEEDAYEGLYSSFGSGMREVWV